MKQNRVLVLGSEEYFYYDEGVYGDIFVNGSRTRCWKLFKIKEPKNTSHESFMSQLKAYQLSVGHEAVTSMVPKLFRSGCSNFQVRDEHGKNVTSEYFPKLNYEMDFFDLTFCKIGSLPREETAGIFKSFKEAGIHNLSDASIAYDLHRNPILIDFGIQEIEVWH